MRFAIFDAWRPISVQAFMVEHAVAEQCALEALDLYGIKKPCVDREALEEFGLTPDDLVVAAELLDSADIASLLKDSDVVISL